MSTPELPDDPAAETSQLDDVLDGMSGGLGGLVAQAQQAMVAAQQAAETLVEGTAGGGMVKIRASGTEGVISVSIDPTVVDPADIETLEELVVAAMRDVNARIAANQAAATAGFDPGAALGHLFGEEE